MGTAAKDVGVDTKVRSALTFDNYSGFVRVRKRALKGGHFPEWRKHRASMSFDLVRAVRVDGKPRHKFVLGLGSQKDVEEIDSAICWFWARAVRRMIGHGLSESQRFRLVAEMVRKGARLPTIEECQKHVDGWKRNHAELDEVMRATKQ